MNLDCCREICLCVCAVLGGGGGGGLSVVSVVERARPCRCVAGEAVGGGA